MFLSRTSNQKINKAIELANNLLKDERFYSKIKEKQSFDMSTASPQYIADMLLKTRESLEIEVNTYYRKWSRAYGYFIASKPKSVYINEAKLNRSLGSIVSSLAHERIHAMDYFDTNHSYGHGDNSPVGKQNTAAYYIDNIAQGMIDKNYDFNNNDSSRIIYRKSFWSRVKSFFRRVF